MRGFCHGWFALLIATFFVSVTTADDSGEQHRLYVATPGIRNYLEYGGHGVLVFDMDNQHTFIKRIPTAGLDESGTPLNVKGICASAITKRLYVSTTRQLMCIDLTRDRLLWQRTYDGGCDRMAIAPDGQLIYLPSLEGPHWHAVDATNGDVIAKVVPNSGAHNTIFGQDGNHVYLAGLGSPLLRVVDPHTHQISAEIGPFSASIRPFTVDGKQRYCYVNVNELLGFEIGDLQSGKMLHRVEVQGFQKGTPKRHGCPSHGIALTPDEREIWLTDAANSRLHIFDATTMPPEQLESIELRDQPGWITFSLDGRFAYPSTGEVIEAASRKILVTLRDETGRDVHSEKMVEVVFRGDVPVKTGDQFGLGRAK